MKLAFRLMAPYLAVGVFWCVVPNAWLAILVYHAQIVFWRLVKHPPRSGAGDGSELGTLTRSAPGMRQRAVFLALPAALAGPLLYVLLPYITHTELTAWLADHRLTGLGFILMIPYFGLLHPMLEQLHWSRLREETPVAHLAFAGYHVLVLYSLLTLPWAIFCSAILVSASGIWRFTTDRSGSLMFAVVSHVLADLGIVVAAWLRT